MDDVYEVRERAKKFNSKLSGKAIAVFVPIVFLFMIMVNIWDRYWWAELICILFLLVLLAVMVLYIGTKQRAVLYYDMDPQLYYAIIHAGDLIKIGTDPDIEIFYFAGDYQKAINSANAMMDKFNAKGKKYSNLNTLNLLVCAYFEIGDYENASKTIDYIKALAKETKISGKKGYTQVILPQLEFVENFIKCDFNKCLELEIMMTAKIKRTNTFISRNKYYTALAKYYSGDISGAKLLFEEIMHFCPKLNYSNFAQQYLNAIHNNEILTLSRLNTDFKYNGDLAAPSPQQVKKSAKKMMIRLLIAFLLFVIAGVMLFAVPDDDEQNMNDDYENSISIVFDIQQE